MISFLMIYLNVSVCSLFLATDPYLNSQKTHTNKWDCLSSYYSGLITKEEVEEEPFCLKY